MVRVIDATLREGMQAEGGTFTVEQSVDVARGLIAAGVDMIECGHPAIGEAEKRRVAAVVEAVDGRAPVLSHARADVLDISAVAETGADWVGVFLGVNDISLSNRTPGRTQDEVLQLIEDTIGHARALGLKVRFTAEDSSRTDPALLAEAYSRAVKSGAERICLADTVGQLEPAGTAQLVEGLRAQEADIDVEVHLHDDRGLATANALAAVDAGANWISTSVNGLGERAGIVDLAGLLANLAHRGVRPLIEGTLLRDLSRRVGAYSRSAPDDRRPVVGANVFRHVSRLHVLAVERDPATYEWASPDDFGARRHLGPGCLPERADDWVVKPPVLSAEELRYHRKGPGDRYVMVDDRFVPGAGQYCIARRIPKMDDYGAGHVDSHVHYCDSLFMFLGDEASYQGLSVEVGLGDETFQVRSPASVFIPAGVRHSYRVVDGSGTYLNHVLAGDYNSSLLEPFRAEGEA
ncbi:hypothetical protein N566_04780 [Streptomycetaceae bacterium MP113-05]|nr:hypothetical protein N566_04780 [Streptomycetaceae bacterium MP113-05]